MLLFYSYFVSVDMTCFNPWHPYACIVPACEIYSVLLVCWHGILSFFPAQSHLWQVCQPDSNSWSAVYLVPSYSLELQNLLRYSLVIYSKCVTKPSKPFLSECVLLFCHQVNYFNFSDMHRKILTISRTILTWIWWPEVVMQLIYKTNSTTNISSP